MRVRPFFWLLLLLTIFSTVILAFTYRPQLPVYLRVHIQAEHLQAHNISDLELHLTDSQGLPIDQANVVSDAYMTNMSMSVPDYHVLAMGNGTYKVSMNLSMAGPWAITIHTQAQGFAPQEQTMLVTVV